MIFLMFILGTIFGSFYLVIGKRLPQGKNVVNDRSRCDNCHHNLLWWQLIPLFSYVILKGRCYFCHKHISLLNPLVEIFTGFLFALGYYLYGISAQYFIFLIIASVMIIIFISDFTYYIILDSPLVIGAIIILLIKYFYYGLNVCFQSVLSGIIMFLALLLVKFIGDFIFKRESLGGGDIKFAFLIGLTVGVKLGLCSLILASFIALPYSYASLWLKKNNEVAFGPFLASSLLIVYLFSSKFYSLLDLIFVSL